MEPFFAEICIFNLHQVTHTNYNLSLISWHTLKPLTALKQDDKVTFQLCTAVKHWHSCWYHLTHITYPNTDAVQSHPPKLATVSPRWQEELLMKGPKSLCWETYLFLVCFIFLCKINNCHHTSVGGRVINNPCCLYSLWTWNVCFASDQTSVAFTGSFPWTKWTMWKNEGCRNENAQVCHTLVSDLS